MRNKKVQNKIKILIEQDDNSNAKHIPADAHRSFVTDKSVKEFLRDLNATDTTRLQRVMGDKSGIRNYYKTYASVEFESKGPIKRLNATGEDDKLVYNDLVDVYRDWLVDEIGGGLIKPPPSASDGDDDERWPVQLVTPPTIDELMDLEAKKLIKELDEKGIKTIITGENQLGGSTQLTTEACESPFISSAAGFVAGYTPDLVLRRVGVAASQGRLMSRIQRVYGPNHKISAAAGDAAETANKNILNRLKKLSKTKLVGGAITVGTVFGAIAAFAFPGLSTSLELGLKKMAKEPKTAFELFDLLLKWNKTNDNFLKETDDGLFVLDPCFATAFFATFGSVALYRGAHAAKMEGFIKYLKAPAENVTAKGIDKIPGGQRYRGIMKSEYKYLLGNLEDLSTFKGAGPLVDDKVREHLQILLANNAAELKRILFDDDAIGKVNIKGMTSPEAKLLERIMGVRLARRKAIEEVLRNSQRLVSDTLASNIEFFKIFDMAAGDILDSKQVSYIQEIIVSSSENHQKILKKSIRDFKELKKQARSSLVMDLRAAKKLSEFENLVDRNAFVSATEPISKTELFDLIKKHFKGDKEMFSRFIGPSKSGDAMQELTEFGTKFHQLHTARAKILLEVDRNRLEQLSYFDLLEDSKLGDEFVTDLRTRISNIANNEDQALFRINLSMNENEVIRSLKRQELPFVPFFNTALKQRKLAIGANLALAGASAFVFQSTASRLVDNYLLGIRDISPTQAGIIHKVLNNPNSSRSKVVEKAIAYAYSKMAEDMGHVPGMPKPRIDGLPTVLGRELPFNNLEKLDEDSKFKGIAISFIDNEIKDAFNPDKKEMESTKVILNILVLEYFKNPHEKDKVATKKPGEEVTVADIIETVNFFAAEGESVLGPAHYNALFEKSYGEVREKVRGFSKKVERGFKEKEQEQSSDVEITKESDYPVVNGKNFINPVQGATTASITHNDFHEPRGKYIHKAIDVKGFPIGTPILAVADGSIIAVRSSDEYNSKVKTYADFINSKIKSGELLSDSIKSMDFMFSNYNDKKNKKLTIKQVRQMSTEERKKLKLSSKLLRFMDQQKNLEGRKGRSFQNAPGDSWDNFRKWSIKTLGQKIGQTLLRYYISKKESAATGLGIAGTKVTLLTDPDQHGNQFTVINLHLSETNVSVGQTVEAGQIIGKLGNTAIFDEDGEHLHLSIIARGTNNFLQTQKIGNKDKAVTLAGKVDPETLIPGLKSNHPAVYSGGQNKKEEANTMNKKDLRQIVSEMLKENSGMGYGGYPYQSNEYDEEEPDQDYQVEWTSFVDEVCGPRKKAVDGDPKTFEDIAIEVAKLFVKDSDLFRDVLELAGSNKSLGTEILRQTKEAREKQE
jgi:murein DD-endopeptidase MepM/ murein hydrolase activator NlpD